MTKLRALVVAGIVAGVIALAGPAGAPPITCPHDPNTSWTLIQPTGQTADIVTVKVVNDQIGIAVRGANGNNQVWALTGSISSTTPFFAPTWTNLGGLTYWPVHIAIAGLTPGSYGLAVVVIGTDGNTYWRRRSGTTWGPWQAHSVGTNFYNNTGPDTYETWSIWVPAEGRVRYYGMGVASAYGYPASQCDWFGI